MTVLVTGAAGFIGFHVSRKLLENGNPVIGIDNVNDYYDVSLKEARLNLLNQHPQFQFEKVDISDKDAVFLIVESHPQISGIIHLAAQAGVRYSLINPYSYIHSNIEGFLVIMEAARILKEVKHIVYASSSSVYGSNTRLPFSETDRVDTPVSLYGATKKSMEMLSHSYAHLFDLPLTGLRFFTAYGPWGRPDMAAFIFVKKILAGEPIPVFNNGDMRRDFTFIDDIVSGVVSCFENPQKSNNKGSTPNRVYNIGNHKSEKLLDYIVQIEKTLGRKAKLNFLPMQKGDVKESFADIADAERDFGFKPTTSISEGIPKFVEWYKDFYNV